jgi:hypothetical protein
VLEGAGHAAVIAMVTAKDTSMMAKASRVGCVTAVSDLVCHMAANPGQLTLKYKVSLKEKDTSMIRWMCGFIGQTECQLRN